MLEVDDDSRLGRELMAGGSRYHAHFVPDEDLTADLYETACVRLEAAGVQQYEISNFAQPGHESRHNLKYWTRQPYLGFGVDAHSMLLCPGGIGDAVRFSSPDGLEDYVADAASTKVSINCQTAIEEAFFLGLRLTRGVNLECVASEFGESAVRNHSETISECVELGLLEHHGEVIRLTARGRLLSNEVFERFIVTANAV
jgi:oxygen-independent coproporphyrinogen-3 oxidase